jgi:hypothetical protein
MSALLADSTALVRVQIILDLGRSSEGAEAARVPTTASRAGGQGAQSVL